MELGGGEGDDTTPSEQDFANSCFFFSQFLLARCSLAVSVIVKQVPGCPLASRAGRMGCLLRLCKHLQTVWETSPSCLLLSCLPLALASRCASVFLQVPASGVMLSYVRLWFCRKARNRFSGQEKSWETLIPMGRNSRRGNKIT